MLREKMYELKNWKNIIHTTFNPRGPGVLRIHMIPPKFHLFSTPPSVVILNGKDILPVNESWAILLTEFIRSVNDFGPHEVSDSQLQDILEDTFYRVRKVYPEVGNERLREDLSTMMRIFDAVIQGEDLGEEIGMMHLSQYAKYMRAPHRMDLMVSAMEKEGKWNCNQKCKHCYAAGQSLGNAVELPTKEWKIILDRIRAAGIGQVTFTGGEPTMREDLVELVGHARWFVTRLNTNGVLLTKELCEKLREAELDSVQITLYSHKEEIHNELVGSCHFQDTVQGIKNAVAAGLQVSVNTPLCKYNREYAEMLAFLHEIGVEYVTCSGLIVTGNARSEYSKNSQLASGELSAILTEAVEYCYENGMEIDFTSPGWIDEETLRKMKLTVPSCGACLSNMAITPDGLVIPCQSWLSGENYGDIRTIPWKKIWNHSLCRKNRDYATKMDQNCPLKKEEKL